MKKFMNKLTNSGKLDVDSFQDEDEGLTNYKKSNSLPADSKDAPEDIKVMKSMKKALSPKSSPMDIEGDFSKMKKSSSSGLKKDDKEKLNASGETPLKKSTSLKNKISGTKNVDPMKSPALKGMVSGYELSDDESDNSMEDEVPRSGDDRTQDDEVFTPVRVPSGSSPVRVPSGSSPFISSTPTRATPPPSSPSQHVPYSPHTPSPRSTSSPFKSPAIRGTPSPTSKPPVVIADDFDLRFGGDVRVAPKTAEKDDGATILHKSEMEAQFGEDPPVNEEEEENEPVMGKSRSGLFSFGNKPRKLK